MKGTLDLIVQRSGNPVPAGELVPGRVRSRAASMKARPYICSAACWLWGAAEQAQPVEIVTVRAGEAVDVIDLERASLLAAFSSFVDERAPAAVPFVDGAFHRVGNMA